MTQTPSFPLQERLAYPDAFRFVAIIGVIFAHLPPARFDTDAGQWLGVAQGVLGWCVLGFFAVAGVFFRGGRGLPVPEELRRRGWRLLVPWLAFSVFYKVAVTALAAVGVIQRAELPPDNVVGVLHWLSQPADPQLYFLLYLFGIQTLCLAISMAGRLALMVAGAGALVAWLAMVPSGGCVWTALHGSSPSLLLLYLACFAVGAWAGRSAQRMLVVAVVFAAAAAGVLFKGCSPAIAWQLVAPWLLLLLLQAVGTAAPVRCMAWLGRFSGSVYVWHAPLVIGFVSIAACLALGGGLWVALVVVVVSFSVAAVIGTLVNRVPALRWFYL